MKTTNTEVPPMEQLEELFTAIFEAHKPTNPSNEVETKAELAMVIVAQNFVMNIQRIADALEGIEKNTRWTPDDSTKG